MPEVAVDVLDHHRGASRGRTERLRRCQPEVGCLRVESDDAVTGMDLPMDHRAVVVAGQLPRPEPEHVHEVLVRALQVP
jgi:hypothetical protein